MCLPPIPYNPQKSEREKQRIKKTKQKNKNTEEKITEQFLRVEDKIILRLINERIKTANGNYHVKTNCDS